MIPFDLDDRVTAAALTAAGTVVGALIQLRLAWRREVSERARGVPVTKKSRRGPVAAVLLLLVAAAVGGFAFSQSLSRQSERESAALRGELHTQLEQISASAARLELASLNERDRAAAADAYRGRAEDVTAVTVSAMVGPCRTRASANDAAAPCAEQDAQRVMICGSVPSAAAVTATALYARPEGSSRAWTESRVDPGQDVGRARFEDKPFERTESDQSKQVCTGFLAWDSERAYGARLVVKYALPPATAEASHAAMAPVSATVEPSRAAAAPVSAAAEVSRTAVAPVSEAAH